MIRRVVLVAACGLLLISGNAVLATGVHSRPGCSAPSSRYGDWPTYGHDLSNTRTQNHAGITAAQAGRLSPVWSFDTGQPSGFVALQLSNLNSTPVELGGCVYVTSAATRSSSDEKLDNLFALDAATGAVVWKRYIDPGVTGVGGALVGSPALSGDRLVVLVNHEAQGHRDGPYAEALDRHTGAILWRSHPLADEIGDYTNASPVVADGVVIAGFSGEEGNPKARGGYALLDAATGALLVSATTIPPGKHGAGAGIWTTAAVDRDGYAYLGTGNPYDKDQTPDPRADAIIKVDVQRSRPTFGRIVDYYTGNVEQFVHDSQATNALRAVTSYTCPLAPDDGLWNAFGASTDPRFKATQGLLGESKACGQFDLDFGASPNLFTGTDGKEYVGELQKSAVYHVVPSTDMHSGAAWTVVLGGSCNACNAASTAYDPHAHLTAVDVAPGSMNAIDPRRHVQSWVAPAPDVLHYESVSIADGAVYTIDTTGFLDVFDEHTGRALARMAMPLPPAKGDALALASAGVAIARGMIFVPVGSHLIALRPAKG